MSTSRYGIITSVLLTLCGLLTSPDAAEAAICRWIGASPDPRWSTAANWTNCEGRAPKANDSLFFPRTSPWPGNENDIADLELTTVTIEERGGAGAVPYDITGRAIRPRQIIVMTAPAPGAGTFLRLPLRMLPANNGFADIVAGSGTTLSIIGPLTSSFNSMSDVRGPAQVSGRGTVTLFNAANDWSTLGVMDATVRLGAAGALPDAAKLILAGTATLDLNDMDETIGRLSASPNDAARILLGGGTLTIVPDQSTAFAGIISGRGGLVKNGAALVLNRSLVAPGPNSYTGTTIVNAGSLRLSHDDKTVCISGPLVINGGVVELTGDDEIADMAPVTVNAPGRLAISNFRDTIGSLSGNGSVTLGAGTGGLTIGGDGSSTTFAGTFSAAPLTPGMEMLTKIGSGTLTLTGDSAVPALFGIRGGRLAVDGRLNLTAIVVAAGGALSGRGMLHADELMVEDGVVEVTLHPPAAGAGAGDARIDLTTIYRLTATARLSVSRGGLAPRRGERFTIINLAGTRLGEGTFQGLPEGGMLLADGQRFSITYRGGTDGNDVVLTAIDNPPPITYFMSEGATGGFFDEDVLIANPHDTPAPVTLTFSKENGEQISVTRTVAPLSRLTVRVDAIPGLEGAAASAQVRSDDGLPLAVERTMFWNASNYAGHTGSSVDRPASEWFFAEGSQGFFETYVLVINPHASKTDVTFTFLRENEPVVAKTITLEASARLTLYAGDVPELVDRSFGIAVRATQPIMAERAMYFGTTATRFWSGGHESAGVTSASRDWFLAEGATGGFFDTFILLSNPQNTPASITLRYLLDTGETVTVPKTIPANARLTTNIEAEDDARLHNAAVSTVVTSDVPIIAERSMYWPGAAKPWGEAHNSFGVVRADTTWGLAEGRVGGPLNFHTYILLANPQATAAEVTVRFLRESGAPIVQTFTVPPTSRFNVDSFGVPGLKDESFGALITVTNGVPIIVERSMYWDAEGIPLSGGTNATGIPLSAVTVP